MIKELKKIMDQYGLDALGYPEDFGKAMREQGCKEKDVHAVMLVLKCCPTVVNALTGGDVSSAEANALVRSAVRQTGLRTDTVRQTLGALMAACGFDAPWAPHLSLHEMLVEPTILPISPEEGETVVELMDRLQSDPDNSAVYSDLYELAKSGNVQAAYTLGQYFKQLDDRDGTEYGLPYFQIAARSGYGPAKGAVAHYLMHRKNKQVAAAAHYFQDPSSICGKDGREWAPLSQELLEYRHENRQRIGSTLTIQLLMLLGTVVLCCLSIPQLTVWSIISIAIQSLGLVWTLISLTLRPYDTTRVPCYALLLSWLMLLVGII